MTYLYLITSAFFMLSISFTFANESLKDNGSVRFNDHFSEPFKHLLSKKITHAIEQGELTTQEAINERKASLNERYLPYIDQTIDPTTLKRLDDICSFSKKTNHFKIFQTLFLAGDFHHDNALNENAIRGFLESQKSRRAQRLLKKKKTIAEKMSQTWASKSEEEKKAIAVKISEARKEAWASKSEEEKRAIAEKKSQTWASKSEEEKRAIVEKMSEARKEAWASRTEEEKKAIAEKKSQAWESRTEEEKKAISEKKSQAKKEFWASKTEEEKRAIVEKMSEARKEAWASRTEEEKRAIVEKMSEARKEAWASKSEEEKKAFSETMSQVNKRTWASRTEQEKMAIAEKRAQTKKRKRMGDSITGDRAVPPSKYKKLTEDQTTSDFERILHDKTHLSSDTESDTESE